MKQKLTFTDSHNNKVVGILSNPKEDTDVPIMILCHGFSSSKEGRTRETLEQRYNELGVATFRFDFFGHGESEGDFAEITVSKGVDDIRSAVTFLNELGYTKIGLFGASYGGNTAFLAAAQVPELFVLVLKCPVSDNIGESIAQSTNITREKWKKQGYTEYKHEFGTNTKVNYTFYTDPMNTIGYQEAAKINIPTLIVHGDADTLVPIEQSKKLHNLIKKSKLIIVPGCDHMFSKEELWQQSIEEFVSFVKKHL
jgi:uncharacterized protein